ncbi:MAG: hypothetical protein LLG05_18380 [Porphyromonadaceae bacterium]|nr:hypothetical protein [Porphyromonadaceae bacterium]
MRKIIFALLIMSLIVSNLIMNPLYVLGNESPDLKLIFFYSPFCNRCQQAEPIIDKLNEKGILVDKYNIQESGNLSLMMQLLIGCEEAPSLAGQVPAFFYNNRVQIGLMVKE